MVKYLKYYIWEHCYIKNRVLKYQNYSKLIYTFCFHLYKCNKLCYFIIEFKCILLYNRILTPKFTKINDIVIVEVTWKDIPNY